MENFLRFGPVGGKQAAVVHVTLEIATQQFVRAPFFRRFTQAASNGQADLAADLLVDVIVEGEEGFAKDRFVDC